MKNYQNKYTMSIKRVIIESDCRLEAVLNEKNNGSGVVICHPHPLYGGSMDNNVVDAVEKGFSEKGFTTLKFNFRGVGASSGHYDEGNGEVNDVLSASTYLKNLLKEDAHIVLAGYSFGAWVCSRAAKKMKDIKTMFIVAYPFSFYDPAPLKGFSGRIFFVGGKYDDIAPVEPLLKLYRDLPTVEKYLKIIESDHFFFRKEREIVEFIKENI
ncbi:MAG TPA: CocE/NonD family hydrolase [Syntrophorhabdaceae bacterium]|nr:CocE/NonD family hydrolase [Syntrophorhabdaceae bacterium]HOL05497.1 CocE/NonD family hydrolase [Syntrophorhabdaceae bacterium]HPC66894.1 CocE/NonD family hydrolase [Syntrophorhabdaceae bacterium]HPP42107.1 CocE/NonD family hydrolase [Syntrophorhabdaceae bacterium]HRR72171.1 CocE/NonD family hydrolase [Syntrophorhabdaceae bacterium]